MLLAFIGYCNSSCGHSIYYAVNEILKLCPSRILVTLYKLPSFDSVDDFLKKVATIRGKLKKGGVVDVEAAARIVLHDWNEGIHNSMHKVLPRNIIRKIICKRSSILS